MLAAAISYTAAGCGDDSGASGSDGGAAGEDAGRDAAAADAAGCEPPTHVRLEIHPERTRLDVGWKGTTYGLTLNRGTVWTLETHDCTSCTQCRVRGPVANADGWDTRRCVESPADECTSDADCASGPCAFLFGAPLSYRVLGLSSCAMVVFAPPSEGEHAITGSVDLGAGHLQLDRLRIDVKLAALLFSDRPACDACLGDGAAFDGSREGSCHDLSGDAPVDRGVACDVGGIGASDPFLMSADCLPPPTIDLFTLDIHDLRTANRSWPTLPADRPECNDDSRPCFCGLCDADATRPCASDADCLGMGACVAPSSRTATPTRPNACADGEMCVADPVLGTGRCGSDACLDVDGDITATGFTSRVGQGWAIQLAAVGCIPPTGNALPIDSNTGFPGPGRYEVGALMTVEHRGRP